MRTSLYEQLKLQKISFIGEIQKINELIYGNHNPAYSFFCDAFIRSPYNFRYTKFDEILLDLFETNQNFNLYTNDFYSFIENAFRSNVELTLDSFLNYLELYRTLLDIKSSYIRNDTNIQIKAIIEYDCEKLGYEFIKDKKSNTFKVMLKNAEAEAAVLNINEATRNKIYRYLTIRLGNVEEKRECILSIYRDIEDTVSELRRKYTEFDKLGQFIQCTRHTENDQINRKHFPFYYENEDEWLDKVFDMIISVITFSKLQKITKDIKRLEKNNL